jgi:hypothetical protein
MRNWRTLLILGAAALLVLAGCDAQTGGIQSGTYSANISLADSAEVTISMPVETGHIDAITTNGINVLEARIEYLGAIDFSFDGDERRIVSLSEDTLGRVTPVGATPRWELRVTNRIPVDLKLTTGGTLTGSLARLNLSGLELTQTSGATNLILPAAELDFRTLTLNAGEMTLVAGRGTAFESAVTLNGGTLLLNVLESTPVQINVLSSAAGAAVNLPESYGSGLEEDGVTTFQSTAFSEDAPAIVLNLTVNGGTVTVQYPQPPAEQDIAAEVTQEPASDPAAEVTAEPETEPADGEAEATEEPGTESGD